MAAKAQVQGEKLNLKLLIISLNSHKQVKIPDLIFDFEFGSQVHQYLKQYDLL